MSDMDLAREYYAEELRAVSDLQSEELVNASPKFRANIFSARDRGRFVALAMKAIGQPRTPIRDGFLTISS
jgi:hypothetical protein